jgi:putative ABC transport system permease protein
MIRFIIKGLMRDRSRSLFPVMMVAAGVFLVVFLYSWMQGVIGDMVSSNARFDTGHVKVMTRAYEKHAGQIPNDLAIINVNSILEQLKSYKEGMIWTPRTRFAGLLDIPDEKGETRAQGPAMGLGVDLIGSSSPEKRILNLEKALVQGRLPQKEKEILLSDEFAKKLGVNMGETATLISSTMNGGMAMYNFTVCGTVRFGITAMDKGAVIADIRDIQAALDMADASAEILGYSKDMLYADDAMSKLTRSFNEKFSKEEDEFSPVMVRLSEQNNLGDYLELVSYRINIMNAIFMAIMSIVLWNSGLMNCLRRYGEIGLRLAIGEPKGTLYRWMVCESIVTGFAGSAIGTLLGVAASYYLQYNGIDIGSMLKGSTMIFANVMRARVTQMSYIVGFVPGLIAPLLGSLFAGIGIYKRQTSQLFKELEV